MTGSRTKWWRVFAVVAALALIGAACGDDDDDSSSDTGEETTTGEETAGEDAAAEETAGEETTGGEAAAGGQFIDYGTFVGDPPEHLDPHLNSTLDAYQVINAVYDGLTEIDASDPADPQIVPLVAESYEPNEDASVWTFQIRDDAVFSNGDPITATTFQKSWERAADLAGDYSYLLTFIDGGDERLAGEADIISGVEADDATRTLTVTLNAPYSNFDAVVGFQLFFPVPEEAITAGAEWENSAMYGNGPYVLEAPRNDQEIILVPNENWQGDFEGNTWDDRLTQIIFRVQSDPDTSYNAFEAGEGDNANIPAGRIAQAQEEYGTTLDDTILGSYHFVINGRDERIGGPENLKLRQAVSAAIYRETINEAVYNGSRTVSTGVVPAGIPGFQEGICEYCAYDEAQAATLFQEWQDEGGVQDGPLPIQFNADAGHEPVIAIMLDNLAAVGIEAEAQPFPSETYFSQLADGACVICRAGWFADYPTYDNFMFDLFHSSALDGNNYGFVNEEFDALVDEAKQTTDADAQGELFRQSEQILLNTDTHAIPVNWYRGDYAYDDTRFADFVQSNGIIYWERIQVVG